METIRIGLSFASYQPPIRYTGFRCLHKAEGGYPNPEGRPIVRPSLNIDSVEFKRDMQLRSYEINSFNPYFTKDRWRGVYDWTTAFTNENGFGRPGDPRADYVNNKDITDPPIYPKLMKGIICGGMFIRGNIVGNKLVCIPGIHAIDVSKPIPPVSEILKNNWYFHATTGGKTRISNFPQGGGQPVIIPYYLDEPAEYPLVDKDGYVWFERWDREYLPNPLTFYSPK